MPGRGRWSHASRKGKHSPSTADPGIGLAENCKWQSVGDTADRGRLRN